ncbi:MAG: pentapeptide repeat-containing protein [Dehalococcoidia bacterium]|jgi:hypothetical protein
MGRGTKDNPYTRKDVLRLIRKNGGTAERLDLSNKFFEEDIKLRELNLRKIILKRAHLEKAYLWGAHLEGADLHDAHLEEAVLSDAHLEEANLTEAHLEGTYLVRTKFEGADLWLPKLSRDTRLWDVDWGSYILMAERMGRFIVAEDTYRQLKVWYNNVGYYEIAGKFFYREMEVRRKLLKWKRKPHLKLWNWALRILCGYGERPERVVISAATIIFGLALAYFLWGSFSSSSFADTLYYSVASFTALGYGQCAPTAEGWAKGMGAAEAVMGVSMMALFLVTFTRKMIR